MALITHTDYIFQLVGQQLLPANGLWVRLHNNSTGVDYFSTGASGVSAPGAFTHSAPPGDYSLYTGLAGNVSGTPTLQNGHYSVPITAGDDAVLGSGTIVSVGPYTPAFPGQIGYVAGSNLKVGLQLQRVSGDILTRFSRADGEKVSLYSGTAPVWTANVASQIAGGILRGPKRAAGSGDYPAQSPVAMDSDPYFAYWGTTAPHYGTAYPDEFVTTTDLLIGGASQAAYWVPRWGFFYDGQTFEYYFKAIPTYMQARLRIDGKLVALDELQVVTGLTPGSIYYVKCDLGSQAMRLIEIDTGHNFGGIVVEPTATITRGPNPSLRVAALTDSIGAGAGAPPTGYNRVASWVGMLGELMGGDVAIYNLGIGSTGFTTSAGVSDFITRVPDVVAANPDILLIQGGQNDTGTNANLQALATTLIQTLQAQLPNLLIFLIGDYSAGTPGSVRMGYDLALRAAAAATGVYFISWLDPAGATAAGSGVVAWATGKIYLVGDSVLDANGAPWSCIADHTSAGGALDVTKFRPTAVFFGTGKVGATTGDGNADVCIQNAGTHPAPRGCLALARATYAGMRAILRSAMTTG